MILAREMDGNRCDFTGSMVGNIIDCANAKGFVYDEDLKNAGTPGTPDVIVNSWVELAP